MSEKQRLAVALSNRNRAGVQRGVNPKTRARNDAQNRLVQAEGKRGVMESYMPATRTVIITDIEQRKINLAVAQKNTIDFQYRHIGPSHPDFAAIAKRCTNPRYIRGELKTLILGDNDPTYCVGQRHESNVIRGMKP